MRRFFRGGPRGQEPYVQLMVAYADEPVTDKHRLVLAVRGFPMTWWAVWSTILFTTALGVVTILSEPSRFNSHIFDAAKMLLDPLPGDPMHAWGWLFAFGGAVLAAATYISPIMVVWVLRFGGAVYLMHGALIASGAHNFPDASYSGTLFCVYVAVIHLACAESIRMILRYRFPKGRTHDDTGEAPSQETV